jgi:hypothetical protein
MDSAHHPTAAGTRANSRRESERTQRNILHRHGVSGQASNTFFITLPFLSAFVHGNQVHAESGPAPQHLSCLFRCRIVACACKQTGIKLRPSEALYAGHELQKCRPAACPAVMDPARSKIGALALVSCGRDVRLPWSQGSYVRSCLTYGPTRRPGLQGKCKGQVLDTSETVEPSDICLYMSTTWFQFSKIDCTSSGPPLSHRLLTSTEQRAALPDLAPLPIP